MSLLLLFQQWGSGGATAGAALTILGEIGAVAVPGTLGDYDLNAVVYNKFTTVAPATGAPSTLGGTPAISVYKDNSLTQSTAGVTLTADFDSVTGLNHFAIDTSADGAFYSAGSFFDIVITAGTVSGISAIGYVVGTFTLRKTSDLKPTTAARTLDVSATGEAGIDWSNVGAPTTTLNLSGTTISTSQVVASVTGAVGSVVGLTASNLDTTVSSRSSAAAVALVQADADDIQTRLPAALVGGRMDSNVQATASALTFNLTGNITGNLSGTVTSLTNAPTSGDFTAAMKSSLNAATPAVTVSDKTGFSLTAAYDAAKTAAQAGDAMTLTVAYDFAKGSVAMSESYAANGVAPTPIQALYAIQQYLMDFSIVGASYTVKKLDNATTAYVVTLNSATAPTAAART